MAQDFRPEEADGSRRILGGRGPFVALGGLAAMVVIGVTLLVAACGGGDNNSSQTPTSRVSPTVSASGGLATSSLPTPVGTPLAAEPTVGAAQNLTSVSAEDRLVIPKYGVNAPLTYRVVGPDGIMPNPTGADDVAYYNFDAWPGKGGAPGLGGNAVFAGHVDSGSTPCKGGTVQPPCEAVFWDIGKLEVGDVVEVLVSGTTHRYSVTSNAPVHAVNGDWDSIVSARAQETITLITCGGDFNPTTREYTHRQVVVAVRI